MKIVFCAAEVTPFAKVGGLADVVGSLPKALQGLGDEVILCIPHYGGMDSDHYPLVDTGLSWIVTHEGKHYPFEAVETLLPQSTVPVYFLANRELFGNSTAIYPQSTPEEETLRYEVFGKAILAFLKQLKFSPDILHLHDWHTANLAVALKTWALDDPFFSRTGTLLSLHNMAYQGIVNNTNWLKEGLIHADALIAVSPTYAREILTPEGGAGLESMAQEQSHKLSGVLNGIDMDLFNPANDVFITQRYDVTSAAQGKAACKHTVQTELGLPLNPEVPLFGMVTRLVEQKGLDILIPLLPELATRNAQFTFLGTGQPEYEAALVAWNKTSENIRTMIGFNMALGQHVYAGSDAFLMPSRFEPCGLGQMIALRYGSLPVVRKTGGLADTVFDADADAARANGFVFAAYTPEALLSSIDRAIALWQDQPRQWQTMRNRGMNEDFSWHQSAKAYHDVYQKVYQQHLQTTVEESSHG